MCKLYAFWPECEAQVFEPRSILELEPTETRNFRFKPPGLVWQEIIAHYPNAGIGVTGNRLAVLNGSYFQDVSAPIVTYISQS